MANNLGEEFDGFDRVTYVLDHFYPPELVDWMVRVGKKEAKKVSTLAMKLGTSVDDAVRIDFKNPLLKKASQEQISCVKAWNSWVIDHGVDDIVFLERMVCRVRMITGQPDIYLPSINELDDIKCANSIKPQYFFQLGAYASMMMNKPRRLGVVRLDKKSGLYEYVTNEDVGLSVQDCIDAFNAILYYFRQTKRVQSILKPREEVVNDDDN